MVVSTGSSNYTIHVWWDEEWECWIWFSGTDGGVVLPNVR
jgi:hypothetical protein